MLTEKARAKQIELRVNCPQSVERLVEILETVKADLLSPQRGKTANGEAVAGRPQRFAKKLMTHQVPVDLPRASTAAFPLEPVAATTDPAAALIRCEQAIHEGSQQIAALNGRLTQLETSLGQQKITLNSALTVWQNALEASPFADLAAYTAAQLPAEQRQHFPPESLAADCQGLCGGGSGRWRSQSGRSQGAACRKYCRVNAW